MRKGVVATSLWALCGLALMGGGARAKPGGLPVRRVAPLEEAREQSFEDSALTIAEPVSVKCTAKSGVCFTAVRTTVVVPGEAGKPNAPPRFARAPVVANARGPQPEPRGAWAIDLSAALRRPALAGNTLFLFYDLEDPDAVKKQQTSALFQAIVKAGKALGAHLSLSRDDGFHPGHTYRLRIVQLLGSKEALLAEGDFSLL
jgi:hypothetical protein